MSTPLCNDDARPNAHFYSHSDANRPHGGTDRVTVSGHGSEDGDHPLPLAPPPPEAPPPKSPLDEPPDDPLPDPLVEPPRNSPHPPTHPFSGAPAIGAGRNPAINAELAPFLYPHSTIAIASDTWRIGEPLKIGTIAIAKGKAAAARDTAAARAPEQPGVFVSSTFVLFFELLERAWHEASDRTGECSPGKHTETVATVEPESSTAISFATWGTTLAGDLHARYCRTNMRRRFKR